MVKNGTDEALIIEALRDENKPVKLTLADTQKLAKAGVSKNIIAVMRDPKAAAASGAAGNPAPKPPAESAHTASSPGPASADPPAATGQATPFPPAFGDASSAGPQKRRLAVKPFDFSTVRGNVAAMFGASAPDIGETMRAMLTARMYQSKNITLLERSKVDALLKEQDFGATNRADQKKKAKIGRVTTADAILLGDIVIFGHDDNAKSKGGGLAGFGRIAGISNFKKEEKAVIAINLRIADTETTEVIETGEARGESSRKSNNWAGMAAGWTKAGAANSGNETTNFEETIIGEATSNAVNKIVAWLDEKVPKMAAKPRSIEGRVASITGSKMYVTTGTEEVRVGDRFEIAIITDEVRDPETKEVIDKVTTKVGEFVVHEVRPSGAFGEYGGERVSLTGTKGYVAKLMVQ
jgi:curli biogenesis system outer membrane secretion channel CsgG